MNAAGRQLRIRQLLESQEYVELTALCEQLEASESSVRRDLIQLESEGLLRRVHGGAIAMQTRDRTLDFEWQSSRMAEEKRRIGGAAAALIEDGQTVILDGGSTTAALSRELVVRRLHVVTNSLAIADVFSNARQIEVTLTGGFLYPRLRVMVGPLCEQMLSSVSADVAVMGIGGITESGFSNNNTLVTEPQRKMIAASRSLIIVADHTKFDHRAVIRVAPLEAADVVVSDAALAPEYQEMLRSRGVRVVLA